MFILSATRLHARMHALIYGDIIQLRERLAVTKLTTDIRGRQLPSLLRY